MEKRGVVKAVFFTIVLAACLAGTARAGAFLSMDPGESTTRDFLLYNELNPARLGPVETFVLMGTGDAATPMGNLTITVAPAITKAFGAVVEYSLIGIAVPFADFAGLLSTAPVVINAKTTAPLKLSQTVTMNATYGVVLAGVFIRNIDGDVDLPGEFNIIFSWAAGTPADAE